MTSYEGNPEGRGLVVNVRLRDVREGDTRPNLNAYAFTSHGLLIDRQPVEGDGSVRLNAERREDGGPIIVAVGPVVEGEATLSELRRLGASEMEFDPRRDKESLTFDIWRPDWLRWWLNVCCVHGHVYKRVGDLDLPICSATVEVYEVDPFWIILQKLPDNIIDLLRQVVIEIDPIPKPDPIPDPIGPIARNISVESQALSRLSEFFPNPDDPNEPHGPGAPVVKVLSSVFKALPERTLAVARSGSTNAFRQELVANAELLRPLFCWFPWRWVTRHKIGQGMTNCEGKFRICFFHSVFNSDKPDLWFRITQNVPGFGMVTIYEKFPVACHTWWNYDCSSEVNLYTTNPLAYTCACDPNVENPGNWVLLDAIGNTFAAQIRGMSPDLAGTTTSSNIGQTGDGRPFAGRLDPILYFSPNLTAAGVKYRVSYQKDGGSGWTALTPPINRSYLFDDGGLPNWGSFPLGPVGELYSCRPFNPPQGTWEVRFYADDRAATYFDTWSLLNSPSAPALPYPAWGTQEFGLFRLKFEIFRNDGTSLPLSDPALGFQFLLGTGVPGLQNPAWPALLDGDALVVPIYIDKRMCVAHITPPMLDGTSADPNCGGLTFHGTGGTVSMPYVATQPGGFFTFSWGIVRGAGNAVPGLVFSPGLVTDTVANMIGTCSDGAAFAINLNVYGTAQDGYSRLGNFDASDTLAFMLIKA